MPERGIHNSEEAHTRQRPANQELRAERQGMQNLSAALTPAGAGRLFSNRAIGQPANAPARTATLQAMQHTHGNRAVQRFVQRSTTSGNAYPRTCNSLPIQRQMFDDDLGPRIVIGNGWYGGGGGGGYSSQPAPAPAPAPPPAPTTAPPAPEQEQTETNPTISLGIPFTDYTLRYTMPWWPSASSEEPGPVPELEPQPELYPPAPEEEEEAERNLRISMGIPFTDYEAELTLPWW